MKKAGYIRLLWVALSLLVLSLGGAIANEGGPGPVWSYHGATGPALWGELSTTFSACKAGLEQSPIDLAIALDADLEAPRFQYGRIPVTLLNTGTTLQVQAAAGNTLELEGETFNLLQMHFHHPSEHTVAGVAYPMELHLVHQNAKGELAVVGIFLAAGAENAALRPLWEALPRLPGEPETLTGVELDLNALLPSAQGSYRYFGSLTTPPCSEIVQWVVLAEPMTLSPAQIAAFQSWFAPNARPTQPRHRRFLLRSPLFMPQ